MNTAIQKAYQEEQKSELREILKEILPPIIEEALKQPQEDRLLKRVEVDKAWGTSPHTTGKYIDLAIELDQLHPAYFNGMKRYKLSEVMNINLVELKKAS